MNKKTAKMYSTIAFCCAVLGVAGVTKTSVAATTLADDSPLVLEHGSQHLASGPVMDHYSHSSHESHYSHYSSRY